MARSVASCIVQLALHSPTASLGFHHVAAVCLEPTGPGACSESTSRLHSAGCSKTHCKARTHAQCWAAHLTCNSTSLTPVVCPALHDSQTRRSGLATAGMSAATRGKWRSAPRPMHETTCHPAYHVLPAQPAPHTTVLPAIRHPCQVSADRHGICPSPTGSQLTGNMLGDVHCIGDMGL